MQKPSAPALDAPANGAQPNRRRVVLTWQTSACANEYRVQVRADSRRGARVVNVVGLTASSFTTPRLARGHAYFWRVKACNSYGCAKSAWRTFAL
ncbi:MAG: hypothetical protein DCC52_09685 [Chloroflexi bacterium]|nr:MAG: hypothetical protein DCC52_09685 [Chloroflexota bacterium]